MKQLEHDLEQDYAAALETHLGSASESALHHAYEFGRKALSDGLGLLDITMLHHEVLSILFVRWRPEEQASRLLKAAEFLAEALSPFEMALRGWHDTAASLRRVSNELERQVAERAIARETARHRDKGQDRRQ